MLCGSPLGASLNGSHVSIWPVARSRRWTPAKPLFCDQTLPSTCELCGLTMFTWAASMFCSGGSGNDLNVSAWRSNFTIVAWYMLPSHRSPALSVRSPRKPVGKPDLCSGTRYSVGVPDLGSSRPRNCSPKLEYQAMPSASTTTSCGWMVSRGRSYSVMTTRVLRPFGRGRGLSAEVHFAPQLRVDVPRKDALP